MKLLHFTIAALCQVLVAALILHSNLVSASALPVALEDSRNAVPKQSAASQALQVSKITQEQQRIAYAEQPESKLTPKKALPVVQPQVAAPEAVKPAPKQGEQVVHQTAQAIQVVSHDENNSALHVSPIDKNTVAQESAKIAQEVAELEIKISEEIQRASAKPIEKHTPTKIEQSFAQVAPVQVAYLQVPVQNPEAKPEVYKAPFYVQLPAKDPIPVESTLKQSAQAPSQDPVKDTAPSVQARSIEGPVVALEPPIIEHVAPAQIVAAAPNVSNAPFVIGEKSEQIRIESKNDKADASPQTPKVVGSQKPTVTIVNGGLGPLNLLAETLCNSQPERLIVSEELSALYSKRASLRKSLFDLMSLKFTNLEKLSSRLSYAHSAGKLVSQAPSMNVSQPMVTPSHGWPVVGKCTSHDLRLIAEAAWCEDRVEGIEPIRTPRFSPIEEQPNSAAVFSKVLHVSNPVSAPFVIKSVHGESASAPEVDQRPKTLECRRKALRLAKTLFNHLAENQEEASESWPRLYGALAEDECARKRVVDIVSALSNFRGESSPTIKRDNVEFAFAMDDLRPKVLESEVSAPLTFDRQFIAVEQFLQQSVKLLMSNIDPERAKLTQLRYRSIMAGPASPDDQCVELHQRLLAKNYPSDCNPNQLGQIADVLRMTAMSLDLWSTEIEISKVHAATAPPAGSTAKLLELAHEEPAPSPQALRECITSLVVA